MHTGSLYIRHPEILVSNKALGQPSEHCPHPTSHCRQLSDRSFWSGASAGGGTRAGTGGVDGGDASGDACEDAAEQFITLSACEDAAEQFITLSP